MKQLRTCLMAAAVIAVPQSLLAEKAAALAPQTSDADFEAALGATPAPPKPSSLTRTPPAMSSAGRPKLSDASRSRIKHPPLPPAGTVPALFRSIPGNRSALDLARSAIQRGELDPYAYTEQVSGPMPLLPGGRAMRCRVWGIEALYTLGREAAPEVSRAYTAALAEVASGVKKPPVVIRGGEILPANELMRALLFHQHAGERPENRKTLADLTALLQTRGFRAQRSGIGDMTFLPASPEVGRVAVKLIYHHSPYHMLDVCQAAGMSMPTGPYLTAELYFPEPEQ